MVLPTSHVKEGNTLKAYDSGGHCDICGLMMLAFLNLFQCLDVFHESIKAQLTQVIHAAPIKVSFIRLE